MKIKSSLLSLLFAAACLAVAAPARAQVVGQPYRLRHLRRALAHIAAARSRGDVWMTTPGRIAAFMDEATLATQRTA